MSQNPSPILPDLAGPGSPLPATQRGMAFYLLGLALTPVLLFTVAFFIVPTAWFANHSQNQYLANLGWAETLHNADCQILIYGDSAALVGVNPLIVQQITGLSACNIAEFADMTMINGMMIPDRYLARNPRPRYFLFLFGPEDLAPKKEWKWVSTFEAIFFRLQHQRDWSTVVLLLKHPGEFLGWLQSGLRLGLTHAASRPYQGAELHIRDPRRGQLPVPDDTATGCAQDFRQIQPSAQWMQDLRTKYGVQGTRVLIDVVPEPDCDVTFPFYKDKFIGLTDNTLEQFPIADYLKSGRLHMNSTGSRRLSTEIGNQIAAIDRPAAADQAAADQAAAGKRAR